MNWIRQHFRQIIYVSFLFPILLVAFVSIAHVTKWYGIGNPMSWAIYLSVAVEVAALSSLAAIVGKMGRNVYFPFILVTLIQFIGNIFYSYQYIQIDGKDFKDWVDLVSPLVTFMGIEPTDMIGHKRLASFLLGGLLPIISLSFLGLLVKFEEKDLGYKEPQPEIKEEPTVDAKDLMAEVSRVRLSQEELDKLDDMLKKAKPRPPSFVNDTEVPNESVKLPDIPQDFKLPMCDSSEPDFIIETLPSNEYGLSGKSLESGGMIGIEEQPPFGGVPVNKEVKPEEKEWIPALSDAEIMDMNLDEHERKFDMNSEDYDLLGNITPNEPISTPEIIIPIVTPTPEEEFTLTELGRVRYTPPQIENQPIEDPLINDNSDTKSFDDIPPEVVDYKPPQTEEVKKK